jgi:hypothetical protein
MAALPNTIKVAGLFFRVTEITKEYAEEAGFIGDFNGHLLRIRVAEDLAPAKKAETLLHEVLHAATDAAGLMDRPGQTDEEVVNPLARVLFSIIKDNPELIDFLQHPE